MHFGDSSDESCDEESKKVMIGFCVCTCPVSKSCNILKFFLVRFSVIQTTAMKRCQAKELLF